MIKLEHVVLASPEQMEFIIEGMRNPMNSWDKSDSDICHPLNGCYYNCDKVDCTVENHLKLGANDRSLMLRLSLAGTDHRKYMRMMPVCVRITAPLYWWKEFDTYKVGTVANSCSTMHKIQAKEFTLSDFSYEHLMCDFSLENELTYWNNDDEDVLCFTSKSLLENTIAVLNHHRMKYLETNDKRYWWQMIQLLPSSYNQTRNVMLNYEVLANIYKSRRNHKLDEWHVFCNWIESLPYYEIIWTTAGVKEV